MPRLILNSKNNKKKILPLEKNIITIGRSSKNTIQLENDCVSRHHAIIERKVTGYRLCDLSSKNGTSINNISITEHLLKNEDIITIGPYTLIYDDPETGTIVVTNESSLAVLAQVGKAINHISNIDDLMNLVLNLMFKLIDADRAMILLKQKKSDDLVPRLTRTLSHEKNNKIIISKTVIDMVVKQKLALIVSDIADDLRLKHQESIVMSGIKSVMAAPLLVQEKIIGIIQVDSSKEGKKFSKQDLDLLCSFSDYLAMGIEQARLNEEIQKETRLRANLERFHSPELVNMIISNLEENGDIDLGLGVEEKEATILFADICNFTSLAEQMKAVEIAQLLNEFFSMITEIIFDYGGTLDKYIGDAVMALFGVPYADNNQAKHAVQAAIEMQKTTRNFLVDLIPKKKLRIKIGINTGSVVAGNIGYHKRMEYTVLGDTVNVASRLCTMCSPGQILIGAAAQKGLSAHFHCKELGKTDIKGKDQKVNIFEVPVNEQWNY